MPIHFGEKRVEHPFYVINNLSEQAILGIDFIQQHSLTYCPDQRKFSWKGGSQWNSGTMKLCSLETIPPLSVVQIRVQLTTENGCMPQTDAACIANIAVPDIPSSPAGQLWFSQTNRVRPTSELQIVRQIKLCYKEVNLLD